MPRELITEAERISAAVGGENAKRYHVMPGLVVAYHAPVQGSRAASVDVQPAVHDVRLCVEDGVPTEGLIAGERYSEPWPILPRVPVQFPTLGGYALWGPLKAGDRVLLLGFDLDPSTFLSTGQKADPPMTRRNSGTHWVALPGDISDPGALPDPGGAVCFGTPGGVMVAVTGSQVSVGAASASDAAGLASKIDAAVSTIVQAFNAHTHTSAAPGSPTTPPVIPIAPAPGSVASLTVKIAP